MRSADLERVMEEDGLQVQIQQLLPQMAWSSPVPRHHCLFSGVQFSWPEATMKAMDKIRVTLKKEQGNWKTCD